MSVLVWLAIVIMTVIGALASLMLKMASSSESVEGLLRDWHFWAGGLAYATAALVNIWVLRHLDLSVVLPLTALTYVWTLVIARVFLGEAITPRKTTAVALVVVGVALIAIG